MFAAHICLCLKLAKWNIYFRNDLHKLLSAWRSFLFEWVGRMCACDSMRVSLCMVYHYYYFSFTTCLFYVLRYSYSPRPCDFFSIDLIVLFSTRRIYFHLINWWYSRLYDTTCFNVLLALQFLFISFLFLELQSDPSGKCVNKI